MNDGVIPEISWQQAVVWLAILGLQAWQLWISGKNSIKMDVNSAKMDVNTALTDMAAGHAKAAATLANGVREVLELRVADLEQQLKTSQADRLELHKRLDALTTKSPSSSL